MEDFCPAIITSERNAFATHIKTGAQLTGLVLQTIDILEG